MPRVLGEQDAGVGADGLAATTDKGVTPNPATGEDTDKKLSAVAPASKATPAAPAAPTPPTAPTVRTGVRPRPRSPLASSCF